MSSLTKIPAGVQYFFDDEARLRREVERRVMSVFAGWSYDEIILPMFDYHDLFARGMGADQAERTYRFTDRDGALLALRPELTSLVARTVATRFLRRARPIRLCYSGEVFRYDEPAERAAREFHQLGVEHIGQPGAAADIEILLVATEAISSLGIRDFRIALAHVDFFNGVSEYLQLRDADRARLRELIDRRNSQALDEFLQQRAPQVEAERRRGFCRLTQIAGKQDALDGARAVLVNERSRAAVEELARVYATLDALGLAEHFDIDLGDAGGLEYYTGLTFKVYAPGWGAEIGGGGRYDHLIGNFGAPEPAVGFSLSLDALTGARAGSRSNPAQQSSDDAEHIARGDDYAEAFRAAREVRLRGGKVIVKSS
ncbi:MAG: ATP phosphoribosyltransferase regulatory subunit [Acidobacteria bacterium]|nr:ATP phosphoribosyltransferase regulatory subunit [Acidobacteriota bacterium]MCW5971084.1 ATP phosphoribosyltransferase regulatory subunit [Blastocatellales bacterium]